MEKKMRAHRALTIMTCTSSLILTIRAAPDCLDNSWHLRQKHDFKEYHLVSEGEQPCNHDCYNDPASLMTSDRGYCTVCRHYHMPRPYIIVSQKDQKEIEKTAAQEKNNRKKSSILAHYCRHH